MNGYTEVRELGRGASGRVVLAIHDETQTPVAIKYLNAGDRTGFRAEARLLADVESPYVVTLYEYVENASGAAIVMELVDGVPLRAMLREHGATEPEAALTVLKGSLLGLAAAHALGVVHRDYKPENVLVDGQGNSKLADFGIAVRAEREGILAGTPSYMPPEQWAGAPASPRTDIYAATVVFFECLTGRAPYKADGDLGLLKLQHEQAAIPDEAVPEPLRGLIRRGLAKDPADRPANASAFLAELESAARNGYGPDWESRGRQKLARRALTLALLFPFAAPSASATALALTRLGPWLRRATVVSAIAVILGGTGYITLHPPKKTGSTLPPSVTTSVSPSPSPTPSPSPSVSPTPSPTAPTVKPPVVTTKPAPAPPKLSATSASPIAYCLNGQYPEITVQNVGGQPLTWSASGTPPLIVSPSTGTLAPGASSTLTVSGQHPPPSVDISITSNGGNKTITLTCS